MTKICHLTSAHNYTDTRILYKECMALQQRFGSVTLIAPCDKNQTIHGVNIIAVKKYSRIKRMLFTVNDVYQKALTVDADIYHIHDPELLRVALKLKSKNKKVLFDIHENIALQIKSKPYIPTFLRTPISILYRKYEVKILKKLNGLVLAENSYFPYYKGLNNNITTVLNMPQIDTFLKISKTFNTEKKNELFYIGGISKDRGIVMICKALFLLKELDVNVTFHCIGDVPEWLLNDKDYLKVKDLIKLHGRMPLYDGVMYAENAKIGLSILKPIDNYINSYSTKIFEYMALGLPVITSNFKLYRDVVEKHHTGLCVNSEDPKEIAKAIQTIFENEKLSKEMGRNGQQLTKELYNWRNEEKKLIDFYNLIIEQNQA